MNDAPHSPVPNARLAAPLPLIRSHILNVASLPTLSATLPVGWTSTWLTRPEWPLRDLRSAQSDVRNRASVPSTEVEMRWEEVGKWREVMEPDVGDDRNHQLSVLSTFDIGVMCAIQGPGSWDGVMIHWAWVRRRRTHRCAGSDFRPLSSASGPRL
jgi:hypothetical protein